jgi:peptide/nickel transport system permease protein
LFLLGTDHLGRDLLSRIIYGSRISLTIGLVGVALSFVFGLVIGVVSGYYGGWIDNVIQRGIEILRSFPSIPLWMALAASLPSSWSPLQVYMGITVVLSFIGWTGLARQVRGKILSLREEDFATAALLSGASKWRIMTRHLLPSFMSHIIVSITLAVPGIILGETSLSFLGLGLRPPVTSWGVLLKEAQNVQAVAFQPWLLTPVIFVIITVLAFNFVGDGLRDAADPYSR